jgi:KDO2-lipid IV(A) lauroyltransferase
MRRADRVSVSHVFETLTVRALRAGARSMSWERSLSLGARLGDLARAIGLRRRVAGENLARAFPERAEAERAEWLRRHYRELGRVIVEYARLAELARAPLGRPIAAVRGVEHLDRLRGRGAILMTGHFSSFELLGAWLAGTHPVDVVARPLGNPGVEALLQRERRAAGVGLISADTGARRVYQALRAGRWVAMLADQDARRAGAFVPFLGRQASTATGPARIALATGAPIVMGFVTRRADGRLELDLEPPLEAPDPRMPDAVVRLTALHAAHLERWVRRHPELWFWLHRRWKTAPPEPPPGVAGAPAA